MCPAGYSVRPNSAKRCHSEPVRAAKQVPLGYTLAWESVSPRLPLRGRCQREALTEGEMPRVFLSPSRLRRQPPPRGGLTARRCRADGTSYPKGICSAALHCRTPSPTRGSTYRPVGRGPCAPPPGTHFSAGHMGPALQVHTPPKKNNAAPPEQRGAAGIAPYETARGARMRTDRVVRPLQRKKRRLPPSLLFSYTAAPRR